LKLEDDLQNFTDEILSGYIHKQNIKDKILYDAVLGTQILNSFEINLIDSPLLQRLRYIHQTSLAFFTFPSAKHSRFEHSLGVGMMAEKIGRSINADRDEIQTMKVAALLHDIGHGPFSHASESIIGELDMVKDAVERDERFDIFKPHEMISYKIIETDSFSEFFTKICDDNKVNYINLEFVGQMIIGVVEDKRNKKFMMDVINGAFDADKLDYLNRDSYFTGLKMGIDLDRLFATMMLQDKEDEDKGIIGKLSGVHVLEQLMFNKMLLYPSVYHHHKSCACDCMLKGIFEFIRENDVTLNGYDFNKISDFLRVTDYDLLTSVGKSPELKKRIDNLRNRRLLKRALVITQKTVDDDSDLGELMKYRDELDVLRDTAKAIAEEVDCKHHDVWIELPKNPSFRAPSNYIIKITDEDYDTLDNFFPLDKWVESYNANKWRGYVFGPDDLQEEVGEAAQKVLGDLFGLKFNEQAEVLTKYPVPELAE
jgi:uncharacterized protein